MRQFRIIKNKNRLNFRKITQVFYTLTIFTQTHVPIQEEHSSIPNITLRSVEVHTKKAKRNALFK